MSQAITSCVGCYSVDQARSAYEQAVNGYTKQEREIAAANVKKAIADIAAVQSIIDQMVVYAPVASQVYQRNVEPGEYVSPGVPLVTLIDLNDLWIHFDLSENLVRTLKLGDRFDVLIPALSDRRITVEAKLIATKGEYASWRATRATGDFDLRTWFFLDNRALMHPFDAEGKRRDYSDIPKRIEDLVDDPYRSLAGELRLAGGYAKDTTPFSEFLWADFLRRRIRSKDLATDFGAALEEAQKLAKSTDARYLPGWCGPSSRGEHN